MSASAASTGSCAKKAWTAWFADAPCARRSPISMLTEHRISSPATSPPESRTGGGGRLTYRVRTWSRFVYIALVIDCFSRSIVGWQAATTKQTPLVTSALRIGLSRRDRTGQAVNDGLVHHSDVGSKCNIDPFRRDLMLEGTAASIADACDNALAESTIGLFKNEVNRDNSRFRDGPLKGLDEVEWVTMAWVDWCNSRRLHSALGDVPPDGHEASY